MDENEPPADHNFPIDSLVNTAQQSFLPTGIIKWRLLYTLEDSSQRLRAVNDFAIVRMHMADERTSFNFERKVSINHSGPWRVYDTSSIDKGYM